MPPTPPSLLIPAPPPGTDRPKTQAYNPNAPGPIAPAYGARGTAFTNVDGAVITTAYGTSGQVSEFATQTTGGITTGYGGIFTGQDATTAYGLYALGVQNTANTETFTNLYGIYADCQSNGANVTVTNCYGVNSNILETLGTITTGYAGYFNSAAAMTTGYGVAANLTGGSTTSYGITSTVTGAGTTNTGLSTNVTGATTNYGVRITTTPASANNFALYADAAAQNYFAGSVGINITNADRKLEVLDASNPQPP